MEGGGIRTPPRPQKAKNAPVGLLVIETHFSACLLYIYYNKMLLNFRTDYNIGRIYTPYSEGNNSLYAFVVINSSVRILWILPGNHFYSAWHSSHFEHWLSEGYLEKIKTDYIWSHWTLEYSFQLAITS